MITVTTSPGRIVLGSFGCTKTSVPTGYSGVMEAVSTLNSLTPKSLGMPMAQTANRSTKQIMRIEACKMRANMGGFASRMYMRIVSRFGSSPAPAAAPAAPALPAAPAAPAPAAPAPFASGVVVSRMPTFMSPEFACATVFVVCSGAAPCFTRLILGLPRRSSTSTGDEGSILSVCLLTCVSFYFWVLHMRAENA